MSQFSEKERDRLRSEMIAEGRELFARFGFERTRIRDVTDAVGIGTSTFYQFFDSKEALYTEVLLAELDSLEKQLEDAMADAESDRAEVTALLRTLLREVRTNSLISRLIIENELNVIQARLSEEERESIATNEYDRTSAYLQGWTENPEFRYDDPEVVESLIRSLIFTTRIEEILPEMDFGVEYETIEHNLVETIVDGLFVGSKDTEAGD